MTKESKNIFYATVACFTGSFASQFLSFGIGLVILKKSNSSLYFGISQFLSPLICFVFMKQIKNLMGKFDLRKIIIGSMILSSLFSIILTIFFKLINQPIFLFSLILIMLSLIGVSGYVFSVSYDRACKNMVSHDNLTRLKTLEEIVGACALIISPIISALIFDKVSISAYIIISVLVDILTIFSILRLKFLETEIVSGDHEENSLIKVRSFESFKFVVIPTIIVIFFSAINVGLPFIQIDKLHLATTKYAITKICWSVGMLISGFLFIRVNKKIKATRYMFSVIMLGAITVFFSISLLVGTINIFYSLIIFNFLFSLTLVQYRINFSSHMLDILQGEFLTTMILKQKNYDQIARAIGVVAFGILFDYAYYPLIFLVSGMFLMMIGVILVVSQFSVSKIDN